MALRDNFALEDMHRPDIMAFVNAATGCRWQQAPRDMDLEQGVDLITDGSGGAGRRTAGMRVRRTTQNGVAWHPSTFAQRSREVTIRSARDGGVLTEAQKQPAHSVDLNVYALANDPPDGAVRTAVLYRASALYRSGLLDRIADTPNNDGTWFKAVPIDRMPSGVVLATYGIDPVDGASRLERGPFGDWIVLAHGLTSLPRQRMAEEIFRMFPPEESEQFALDVLRLYWAHRTAA